MDTHRRALLALVVLALAIVPAVAFAAAPANDNLSGAETLTGPFGTVTGDNTEATDEQAAGEPDHANTGFGPAHSVWYRWQPNADGTYHLDTCGSSFNTRIALYVNGTYGSPLSEIASNDDSTGTNCGGTQASELTVTLSGGGVYLIAVDTSGPRTGCNDTLTRGPFRLRLDATGAGDPMPCPGTTTEQPPTEPPPSTDDGKTTAGTPVPARTVSFEVPALKPQGTTFYTLSKLNKFTTSLREQGVTYVTEANPQASKHARTQEQKDYLRRQGYSDGELLWGRLYVIHADGSSDDLDPKTTYSAQTPGDKIVVDFDFFSLEEDNKAIAAEKAELEREARERAEKARRDAERKEAKSRCLPIAAGLSPGEIADTYFPARNSAFVSLTEVFEVLAKLGCDIDASYGRGKPSAPSSYLKNVTGLDAKSHTISVSIGQPGSHDFVFAIREEPKDYTASLAKQQLPLSFEGHLTTSSSQLNRVTVQVIERASGRLVSGVPVTFVGKDGEPATQNTNGDGEVTFTAKIAGPPSTYRLSASYMDMEGWINLRSSDHGGGRYMSMAGRQMKPSSSGYVVANQAELDFAKTLPVVPALMGTGKIQSIEASPVIDQAVVTKVEPSGAQLNGPYNTVDMSPGSFTVIGAAPGLIAGADPTKTAGRRAARASLSGALEWLGAMVTPLRVAIDNSVANVRTALTGAQQAMIAQTANLIGQAGGNLISDKGLGVISTGGGNLIGQAGGNLISDKGLGVISVGGGNLISDKGLGVISDNGLGVISTGGGNLMPMHGGRVISTGGGN